VTRAGISVSLLLLLTTPTSCSSALSMSGDLDGEAVPAGFSGAMAQVDIGEQDAWFGVWSTFADTCGLAGALMGDINEHTDDPNDTDDTIEDFFADVPGDFWLMTTAFYSRDSNDLDDEEDFDDINAFGFLCHFTDGPDLSATPRRACASIGESGTDATLRLIEGNSLSFSGELQLVQQDRSGTVDAGNITGAAMAPACPAFQTAMDEFLADCVDGRGGNGCQTAFNAYVGSHTTRR